MNQKYGSYAHGAALMHMEPHYRKGALGCEFKAIGVRFIANSHFYVWLYCGSWYSKQHHQHHSTKCSKFVCIFSRKSKYTHMRIQLNLMVLETLKPAIMKIAKTKEKISTKKCIHLKGEAKPQMHALLHESNKYAYKNISTTMKRFSLSTSSLLSIFHAWFAILVPRRHHIFRWCCAHRKMVSLCAILLCIFLFCSSLHNLVVCLPNIVVILGENIVRSTIRILVWDNNNTKKKCNTKERKKRSSWFLFCFFFTPFFLVFL